MASAENRRRSESRQRPPTMPPGIGEIGLIKHIAEQLDQVLKAEAVLLKRADDLDKQVKLILKELKEIEDFIENLDTLVTPELEAAVKAVAAEAVKIDEQVPDKP